QSRPALGDLLTAAAEAFPDQDDEQVIRRSTFFLERLTYLLEQRGFDLRNIRAVTFDRGLDRVRPADELKKLTVLTEFAATPQFQELAKAFKRVRNIGKTRDFT